MPLSHTIFYVQFYINVTVGCFFSRFFSQILLDFTNLEILYLHGNSIADIKEVDKLAGLRNLRKLTLHGNGIEKEKVRSGIYRAVVPDSDFCFYCISFVKELIPST